MPEPWRDHCAYLHVPTSWFGPAEYCEDDAVEGEPYCAEHGRLADD